ncbi:PucR family transcriptional regulator [Pseudonocardia asaccharolytica]|uniref:PucR C-terminal helix-turn-helix domain-containing protein n=1 Tax=Pseudonocardia asaccharolytica DSM 44247 = NBRC 16224 TaxID=1123024 RepID=A0A511CZW6_9PSEU|nr:helix-turn-helix domain-containing protein [Pseudonocardia asaccharolytica]GEL18081.1 hypothetical protein PA7_19180 [Pseudonocardia asaccharolytica DSM 44247 = NBRC 16224]
MTGNIADDIIAQCGDLVRLASASDSPEGLVAAASHALGRPLALLDTSGALLVASSPSARPDAGVLTTGSDGAPAGWHVLSVEHAGEPLAVLAVRDGGTREVPRGMLELVGSLLGEQFARTALASAVRGERRTALLRRLVTDDSITAADIRTQARSADLRLADCYWPALLAWTAGHPGPRTLAELDREAQRLPGTIAVTLTHRSVALLIPVHGPDEPCRASVHRELGRLVYHARHLGHRDVHAIADERSAGLSELPARVGRLRRMRRYLPHTAGDAPVRPARSFALACLLTDGLERRRAEDFVRLCLRRLLRHDRDHGTDLARVLELALDFPRRDDAAHAGYMHRNTFRRHLAQALELVDTDLEDPEDRLTVHVALKLRRLLDTPLDGADATDRRGSRGRGPP